MHPPTVYQTTRRGFLAASLSTGLASAGAASSGARPSIANKALIAITLDLEMSREYPRRDVTEWDYEKGNLNEETKRYTVEACRRVIDAALNGTTAAPSDLSVVDDYFK